MPLIGNWTFRFKISEYLHVPFLIASPQEDNLTRKILRGALGLDQSYSDRVAHDTHRTFHSQSFSYQSAVEFYRLRADTRPDTDLLRGQIVCDESYDFFLTLRQ